MRYGISTITGDWRGDLILDADLKSTTMVYQRRMNSAATLDGKTVLMDLGFTTSDNIFQFKLRNISAEILEQLKYLVQNYGAVNAEPGRGDFLLSSKDGVFRGAFNDLNVHTVPVTVKFYITEQVI